MRLVQLAAVAFFIGSLLLILVLVIRRSFLARRAGRRDALVARLRPMALAFVDGESTKPVPDLQGTEAEVFAALLDGYARLLSGEARERIAAYFEASGGVDARAWKRASAAFTLGDMCSLRAAPSLIRGLDDRARDVRMAARRSLGRLGALDAIEPLISASLAGPRAARCDRPGVA
jgi:HEAT repeat protein